MKGNALSPLMGVLKPLAKKYVSEENINRIFDGITSEAELEEGEKAVVILNRTAGSVYAGVYAVNPERRITRCYSTMPVEDLINRLLES